MSRRLVGIRSCAALLVGLVALVASGGATAQWVEFLDSTASRVNAPTNLVVGDVFEKDYAWGDLDNDGDVDMVIVRKEPFTSPGKRRNVLLMNEGGVLVDRTTEFASAAIDPTDQGFLTPTNDRDVQMVDVNNDGWLDVVTATTISDADPKLIGHPRIYMNLGEDAGTGDWLGLRYEDARIPTMLSYDGSSGFNPRFCSVAAADVTGDGFADLWFGDYDSSGAGGFGQPAGADYNDRLLINRGDGTFDDETANRFAGTISVPGAGTPRFEVSAFGAAAAIADMNNDGMQDIIKQTSLNDPLYVGVAYNTQNNEGFFGNYDVAYNQSPYFVSVGDLNNDGIKDMVITDDGADRYLLASGIGGDGKTNFISYGFAYDAASDDGFGSNSVIADLNNDGWQDVLIADVDVDIDGCSRRMHIFRNLGGQPGGSITLQEQTEGSGCETSAGNPSSCVIGGIPSDRLEGVHDVAVFDLNNDGWLDMVVGRCSGTQVYLNQAPQGLAFSYPQGLPFFIAPGEDYTIRFQVTGFGGVSLVPGSAKLFTSIEGGGYTEQPLTDLGGGLFEGTLPAATTNCTDTVAFYVTADGSGAGTFTDPAAGASAPYKAIAAVGTQPWFEDDLEGDLSGWTVVDDPSLVSGSWEAVDPTGTFAGAEPAAPDEDADAPIDKVTAFVTQNGQPGQVAGDSDVDGGPTDLISPPVDLAGTDGTISVSRWHYSSGDRNLQISVSGDGTSWTDVENVKASGSNQWAVSSFRVGEFITPTSTVQVRFRADDTPNTSLTESAIDALRVDRFVCQSCTDSAECVDGNYCNGDESCDNGLCLRGADPCPGQVCEEATDSCFDCLDDLDCSDNQFCTGVETCAGDNTCLPGPGDPCGAGTFCDEGSDTCAECLVDAHCDDGVFCNGAEACVAGTCQAGPDPCPGRLCDAGLGSCLGNVPLQPKAGEPLNGLTADQLDRFFAGRISFDEAIDAASGLGPLFNQTSCGACHNSPLGGAGSITVTRFGQSDPKSGAFDPLDHLGGSLLQANSLSPSCEEVIPPEANVTASRLTPSTLGFGLVEAIPDGDITSIAAAQPAGMTGETHVVEPLEALGTTRVGRFGWKAQVATVLTFSADAALNEMGLTNRLLTSENAPNGDLSALAACDATPDPEDGPDADGFDFIDRVTDFQRYLAPPPQTPRSGMSGEAIFTNIGCVACHTSAFQTADDPQLEDAIRDRQLKPYSDFLVHDMGPAADFIVQGTVGGEEMRTTPLWGLRDRDPIWHDGRIAGGTFAERMNQAIQLHGQFGGEARPVTQNYLLLPAADKQLVIDFLASLGRAEFDLDGDGDVDGDDWTSFNGCFSGPGAFYTADDPCAIADADQDGDVDEDDRLGFYSAADGAAGRTPDGADVPGTPLTVELLPDGDLSLSWDASCTAADSDYEVYEGAIGDFGSHAAVQCSTAGATSTTLTPSSGASYYLVVPSNGFRQGSFGAATGGERDRGVAACLPQSIGSCD